MPTNNSFFVVVVILILASVIFMFYSRTDGYFTNFPVFIRQVDLKPNPGTFSQQDDYPETYKSLRRLTEDLKNIWLYSRSLIVKANYSKEVKTFDEGYTLVKSQLMHLMKEGEDNRKQTLDKLSEIIRNQIYKLQHPKDCKNSRLLLCNCRNEVGFSGNLHSLLNCLLQAYVSNRTLVYRSQNWHYDKTGWTYAFLPLGNCTDGRDIKSVPNLLNRTISDSIRVVALDRMANIQNGIYWSTPEDIEHTLKKMHGDPYAWWIGQFVLYAMRLQPWLSKDLDEASKRINFNTVVAGIHVRWGDKVRKFVMKHEVEEYMFHVEKWFQSLEQQGQKINNKTVYVATEEPTVLPQLKSKYPDYHFIGNYFMTAKIKKIRDRYEEGGLENIVADIYFLSKCDYIVCTHSSGVCRTVYELSVNNHPDTSTRIQTLDTVYHTNHGFTKPLTAIMDHEPADEKELQFRKGDRLFIFARSAQPTNIGYLSGRNPRTKKSGIFPAFKVQEIINSYDVSHLYDFT